MAEPQVRGTASALFIFADIIDSSKFSSVLGFTEYAKRLVEFRQLFEKLGNRYFKPPADKGQGFSQVDTRGDEGTIFQIAYSLRERRELIFRAIEFLYHVKSCLYLGLNSKKENKGDYEAPLQMDIGAGIHFGKIAFTTEIIESHSEIVRIDGYEINRAKRIESSSRSGNCSRIVLSKEAVNLLEGEPVIFSPITTSMKGIEQHVELYEVQAGLFNGLKLDQNDPVDECLISRVSDFANNPDQINEPWLKSLIVSVLDVLITGSIVDEHRSKYKKQQLNLAWRSTLEDDPILLYLRAKDYQKQEKYTQQIRYLRQILERCPGFVFAKKRMVEACWKIAGQDKERVERVFARDVAEEFLSKFSQYLSNDEKREFAGIVKEAQKKAR